MTDDKPIAADPKPADPKPADPKAKSQPQNLQNSLKPGFWQLSAKLIKFRGDRPAFSTPDS
ncbi:MAG: hypothetical protein HC833_03680 [Leptolyngbyaceae cyanobacterium RM1_406_9]|nr:hypothetical protein [Leptolyngbyaceae cyanobacterium RM1_406_9]